MSAHMRMHPIRPNRNFNIDLRHLKNIALPVEKKIPWRDSAKEEIKKYSEIGLMIRGGRFKKNLTQKQLAKLIGAKPHHISEMEHGKRTIGKKMAMKLAKIFDVDYRVFL